MRLLVTRPEPDASIFAEELRGLGHEPVLQPLIEFRVLEFDLEPLRAAEVLIITSGNSLRALQERGVVKDIIGKPLYCVGEQTAKRALASGFETVLEVAETGEDLARKIIASGRRGAPLAHIMGEHMAFDIVGALAREGFSIQTVTVYSMEARREFSPAIDAMLKAGDVDGVILMSPRTAEIYVSLCHRHGIADCAKSPLYFCLSENVAAKLASLKPNHVRVPAKPNRKALLELLLAD
jgi:uroporphyrinogen-III synthase